MIKVKITYEPITRTLWVTYLDGDKAIITKCYKSGLTREVTNEIEDWLYRQYEPVKG
jgi:hypothetical protein